MAFIVELVSRSGRLLERHRVPGFSATIGRGYDNDLIVGDPYLEARHLRVIRQADTLQVEPLSATGRTLIGRSAVVDKTTIASGDIVVAGRTRLRLLTPDHTVEPALILHYIDEVFARLSTPMNFALGFVGYLLVATLNQYVQSYQDVDVTRFALQLTTPLFFYGGMAALWALISRVFRHEPRFLYHCWAVLIYLTLLILIDWLIEIVTFNTHSLELESWLSTALNALAMLVLISLNLRFAFQMSDTRRQIVAVSATAVFAAYLILNVVNDQPEFSRQPAYVADILPDAMRFRRGTSLDQYVVDAQSIFQFEAGVLDPDATAASAESAALAAQAEDKQAARRTTAGATVRMGQTIHPLCATAEGARQDCEE